MEYLRDVQRPIMYSLEDIRKDMFTYASNFDKDCIPHISEGNQIVDKIHNFRLLNKPKEEEIVIGTGDSQPKAKSNAMESVPSVKERQIEVVKRIILQERTSRLIGLIAHLAYWNVFGQFNRLPLDMYHKQ